jgi:tetratricopeptide (TPR) repeat protein
MTYLPILCRLPCHPDHWQKIKNIFPSSETYCRLGEACECDGQYECAEQLYQKAADMVPNRISPNYHLWQLYVKQGDCTQAHAMAQKILSQPVKVENTFTLRVKGQIKRYLLSQVM